MPEGTTLRHYAHDQITALFKKKKKNQSHACACGHQMCQKLAVCVPFVSVVLVVPQPIGVRVLNQLISRSFWFNSCSFVSLPGETTHFQSFQIAMPKWKLKVSSWVINLVKTLHTKLSGKNVFAVMFPCTVWSTQSTKHVKCSACFLGLFCLPWRNVWRWMTCQLEASHQQRESDWKYTKDFVFYGLWDAVFTAFGCNLSRDAFHKFLCSAQHCSLCSQSC